MLSHVRTGLMVLLEETSHQSIFLFSGLDATKNGLQVYVSYEDIITSSLSWGFLFALLVGVISKE